MKNKRGIILLAQGPQKYYQMATNLCASIKVHSDLPVCLVIDRLGMLHAKDVRAFDKIVILDPKHRHPFYAKTTLYQYSPFDETLYLDVDSMCIGDPNDIFEKYSENFYSIVHKTTRYQQGGVSMLWANVDRVMEYYGFEDAIFHELQSSAILWRKSREASDIFTAAEHYYACEYYEDFNGLAPQNDQKKGLGWFPDELAFEVALMACNAELDQRFNPIYFDYDGPYKGQYFSINKAAKGYQFFSMPGGIKNCHQSMWEVYNALRAKNSREAAKIITGEYAGAFNSGQGYKIVEQDKAANKVPSYRFEGLRRRKKSAKISKLIEKYRKGKENGNS